jgi:hypothetical protein
MMMLLLNTGVKEITQKKRGNDIQNTQNKFLSCFGPKFFLKKKLNSKIIYAAKVIANLDSWAQQNKEQ